MKKFCLLTLVCLVFSTQLHAQDHIRFNGATFGQPLQTFTQSLKGSAPSDYYGYFAVPRGYNSNLCNHTERYITLNSQKWQCHIFSSRSSNTVFRTVSVNSFFNNDLKNQLKLLVETLEGKYGGGVQEKQEDLGEIGYRGYSKEYKREMLALYYYVKDANNRAIGEIRISAAPANQTATNGYIEISYTDYNARSKSTQEYNALMNDTF